MSGNSLIVGVGIKLVRPVSLPSQASAFNTLSPGDFGSLCSLLNPSKSVLEVHYYPVRYHSSILKLAVKRVG